MSNQITYLYFLTQQFNLWGYTLKTELQQYEKYTHGYLWQHYM